MIKNLINIFNKYQKIIFEVLLVGLIIFLGYIVFLNNKIGSKDLYNSDIHWEYQWGVSTIVGQNPYLNVDTKNLLTQEKVPGLLPLYFYIIGFIAKQSHFSFVVYLDTIRNLVFLFYSLVAILIYLLLRHKGLFIAITAMCFFMFNRWVIYNVINLKQDTFALTLTLIALILLLHARTYIIKNRFLLLYLAFFVLGVATGVKHLTFFIMPIFALTLIKIIGLHNKLGITKVFNTCLMSGLVFVLPLFITSAQFIKNNPISFASSIIYNVTRESEGVKKDIGFDRLLTKYNQDQNNTVFYYMLPRLPILTMFIMSIYLLFTKKLSVWKYSAFIYLMFIGFNNVIFAQYYTWVFVFITLGFLGKDEYVEFE